MKIRDRDIGEIFAEIKNVAHLAKAYTRSIIICTVMALVSTAMGLLTSLVSQSLIDVVTKASTKENLMKFSSIYAAVGAVVAFAVFKILFSAFNSRISEKIRLKINTEMTADIFDRFICSKWEYTSLFASGDVLNRFNNDVSTVAGGVIGIVPTLITKMFQFIASFAIVFYYDKVMALLALITIPLSLVCSKFLIRKMHEYSKELRKISSKMMAFNSDALMNMQYLKSFGLVTVFCTKLRKIQREYVKVSLDYNRFSIITTSVMSFLTQLVSYVCFGWGIYRLWEGVISFGTLVLFLQLAGMLSSAFSSMINVVPTVINAATSSARLTEIKNLPSDDTLENPECIEFYEKNKNNKLTVELKNIDFKYTSEEDNTLTNVDFSAETGDFVALMGPSGEGKTTLLRIMLSLVSQQSGTAEIKCRDNGESVDIMPSTRRLFSYVPQKNTMFGDTLSANMRLVNENATDEDIEEALKTACAYDFIMKEKDGINCLIGDGGTGFSEGQLQRLSIARALLRDAPIVLFDEATSALDAATEKKILENLSTWGKIKICIFTTHRNSVFDVCNKAYMITGNSCEEIMSGAAV